MKQSVNRFFFFYWLFVAKRLWVKWFTVAGKPSVACEYCINKD